MLANASVHPTLPVEDYNRAKKFYTDTLGLKSPIMEMKDACLFQCGEGSTLFIYKRGRTKADHTAANFMVTNVEQTVKDLRAKGVKFDQVKIPEMGIETNPDGIATMEGVKSAWFKDTEGNILSVTQMPKQP